MRKVYFIATPIGNLSDISLRALEVLREVDLILCEDTRHSGKLLRHYDIKAKTLRFDNIVEKRALPRILKKMRLVEGDVAVICDAGTPGVSDPGIGLIRLLQSEEEAWDILPGASALNSALLASAYGGKFYFLGFLPLKKSKALKLLKIATSLKKTTCVFFESPRRLPATLNLLCEIDCKREIFIAREMSKIHQTFYRDNTENLLHHFSKNLARGEITVVISPPK